MLIQTNGAGWLSGEVGDKEDGGEGEHWEDRDSDAYSGEPQMGKAAMHIPALSCLGERCSQ